MAIIDQTKFYTDVYKKLYYESKITIWIANFIIIKIIVFIFLFIILPFIGTEEYGNYSIRIHF